MVKSIGIIGVGSVGSCLVKQMYEHDPSNIYVIARGERGRRLKEGGLTVNGETFCPEVLDDESPKVHLDLVIIAVKTYSIETAMEDIASFIDKDTMILPIENGIFTTDLLRERFPDNRVFYGIVLRTDAHRMGRRVYFNTLGELQFGYADNTVIAQEVQEVYDRLTELGVNARIYEDMRKTQWRKWMLNTGASQAAAEVRVECGFFEQVEEIEELIRMCMDEILVLARYERVNVDETDRDELVDYVLHYPADKKMSMLQDLEAGRPIEIDEYAGAVIKLGEKHGVPTPVNRILYLTINARRKVDAMRKHL